MPFFYKKSILDIVIEISVFPKIGSAVLKVENKLVAFSPTYFIREICLLKHRQN